MNISLLKPFILPLAMAVGLTACGGGGGSSSTDADTATPIPTAPSLAAVDYDIRQLVFSWAAVQGADYYQLFENIDGVSGFSPIGDELTATSYRHDISVLAQDWPNARYLLEACNSAGCAQSTTVFATESTRAIGYFKASDTAVNDAFGFDVAMSGDGMTLVAGAPYRNGESGAAYVFFNDGSGWTQQALIEAEHADAGDAFGRRIALSQDGNTLAIGARNEDSDITGIGGDGSNNDAADSGAVYVFTRAAGVWTQQAYIKATDATAGDNFGYAVSLDASGNTLAVGAINMDVSEGGVYLFTRSGAAWNEDIRLKASDAAAGDLFGYGVALSTDGETLAVGAIGRNGNQGAAYIYILDGGGWPEQAQILATPAGDAGDYFGRALSLSADGDTLAVGAYGEDSNAITIDGDANDNSATNAGAAYIFTRNAGTWSQQAYIKAPNAETGDNFGFALDLSLDGNTLVVGAANTQGPGGEDSAATGIDGNMADNSRSNSGAAYLFHRDGSDWRNGVYIKASNTGPNDAFGAALSLSDDGRSLVVGAFGESSAATGVGGDQTDNTAGVSGAAYLY